jgi:hypothetical protein
MWDAWPAKTWSNGPGACCAFTSGRRRGGGGMASRRLPPLFLTSCCTWARLSLTLRLPLENPFLFTLTKRDGNGNCGDAHHDGKIWEGVLALFVADVVRPSSLESLGDCDLSRCCEIGGVRILEIGWFPSNSVDLADKSDQKTAQISDSTVAELYS